MITTQDIESLDWEHYTTAKNGGSKVFRKWSKSLNLHIENYSIMNHYDNFIKKGDARNVISITKISDDRQSRIPVWEGIPDDIKHFKRILVDTGADLDWLSEIREQKIDEVIKWC